MVQTSQTSQHAECATENKQSGWDEDIAQTGYRGEEATEQELQGSEQSRGFSGTFPFTIHGQ